MENASKALLIAGAILIVILLIAVGMLVYSKSRDVIDEGVAQMSSAEIQMFNAQFTIYEGMQTATAAKKCLETVRNNNVKYKDDESKWVYAWTVYERYESGEKVYSGTGSTPDTVNSNFERLQKGIDIVINSIESWKGNKKYKVKIIYGENGCVRQIYLLQKGTERFTDLWD